ncbi:MAG: Trm112 family protein [Thermoguttaceae bacterium]
MQENLSLEFLVCPQNQQWLQAAEAVLIERLNQAIVAGQVTNAAGHSVEKPIDGGLIREDGQVLYPIVDEIPILMAEEAIAVDQLRSGAHE